MPGAPPDRLESVADMRGTPFCRNEIVGADHLKLQLGPGRQRPAVVGAAKLGPGWRRSA